MVLWDLVPLCPDEGEMDSLLNMRENEAMLEYDGPDCIMC